MGGGYGTTQSLKYLKKSNIYKNSTETCYFNPTTLIATSYSHWVFVKKINNKLVFNDFHYSQQTTAHQSCVKLIMDKLKIKIDVFINTRSDLDELENGLKEIYTKIFDLKLIINKNKNKKYKNLERKEADKDWNKRIFNDYKTQIINFKRLGIQFSSTKINEIKFNCEEQFKKNQEWKSKENKEKRIVNKELEKKSKDLLLSGKISSF
jgi:hypothetical protein